MEVGHTHQTPVVRADGVFELVHERLVCGRVDAPQSSRASREIGEVIASVSPRHCREEVVLDVDCSAERGHGHVLWRRLRVSLVAEKEVEGEEALCYSQAYARATLGGRRGVGGDVEKRAELS
eukprot:scaffold2189_cov161-Isochrysis_galbana.AAC.2